MTDHLAVLEELAILLWHRFAPDHHIEWEDETHKAEYRDVAEAAIALMRGQSWQPVETAPKNKHVLVCAWPHVSHSFYGKVSHVPIYGWLYLYGGPENVDLLDPQPTHWMPLPESPKEPAE